MLEKPDLQDARILDRLREEYGLAVRSLTFLPLGADQNTAVYRALTDRSVPCFVKLRRGPFDETTIRVPHFLHEQGIPTVIAPIPTRTRQLWTAVDSFTLAVFPFVEGRSAYEVNLRDDHWVEFGRALKAVHASTAHLPPALRDRLPRENYSAEWREQVRGFQALAAQETFADPVAAALAALLRARQTEISALVRRAEDRAALLRARPAAFVLCHADLHAGNLLIDSAGRLYLVDWDTVTLAPKERDLMFVGGGLFGGLRSPAAEEALFYQGYGPAEIDCPTLAYYRCERVVQDIAAYCGQLLLTDQGGQDRENGLRQITSQFLPGEVVELALRLEC